MNAFEPKGIEAEWRLLYLKLREAEIDTVFTYTQLSDLLGRPFLNDRGPIYRARQELEANDKRSLVNVPRTGYRIARPEEHESLARKHHKSSRAQLGKAISRATSADREGLDHEARRRIDLIQSHLTEQAGYLKRLERKTDRLENGMERLRQQARAQGRQLKGDVAGIDDRVARLEEALRARGFELTGSPKELHSPQN